MPANVKYELKLGAATREAFGKTLAELGHENANIVVGDADLTKSTMTTYFAKEFPERLFECGIAEANMVAIGAGLALSGKIPFVSSFSAFVMTKGFEQLRCLVAYPNVNLKVVGTHSGISIGEDGPSQMSMEDLALACALPNFTVLCPADEVATAWAVRWAAEHVGPVFIRTGRVKVPVIYPAGTKFEIGKAVELVSGTDVTLIATGLVVAEAIRAAEQLEAEGISARVLDIHTIKPIDEEAIGKAAAETGALVVAEEHLVDSGLGVRVAQAAAKTHPAPIEFVGLTEFAESATPDELLDKYGMRADNIAAAARRVLARKK
ncbi:transketolase family protein [Paludibaculum fermentans]|uniref:Transketolase family protein n=1 Tax=Paludibaculum fermentans TaxID=1473598 RepID=A0A7S7SL23_PALFE|nr:transketolase C-terminal domain-containing protein [Paludibaculum fermentans]QOY89782.1 transketolase family protein [Paludibaculum fermentans]